MDDGLDLDHRFVEVGGMITVAAAQAVRAEIARPAILAPILEPTG